MKREDEILRETCALLAQEETQELEKSISPKMEQAAEALYQRHRRRVFALISQNTKRQKGRLAPYLRAAACLVLALGAAWLFGQQNMKDPVPADQLPTVSVMPYFTVEPSPSPSVIPTDKPTTIPTEAPEMTEIPTIIPTETQNQTEIPTEIPTETPSPVPTMTPEPTATPAPERKIRPDDWSGLYLPGRMPDAYQWFSSQEGENKRTAVYTDPDGKEITFTEYDAEESIQIPEDAEADYVPLLGGVALRIKTEEGVTLIWQMDGRTLMLTAGEAQAMEIAESVEKISAE